MKNLFIALCLLLTFGSCQTETTDTQEQTTLSTATDTTPIADETTTIPDRIKKLTIKNASDYDANFIKELRQQPLGDVTLDGNLFIEDGQEMSFPFYPKLKKKVVLTGKKDDLAITLTVERINQTTIEYNVEMVESGKPSHIAKGTASITATFYMGSETDENSETGMAYGADEYINMKGDCNTFIRLGKEDEKGRLLGKLIKNCNDKLEDIDLDSFPTLVEQ